ncbi:MAG: DUF1326 domain-containing protein [Gammaproteobacteria bacterium]|nr:DUF1326 domain-containing protein [Gammaproteobacteria bacterium]
MNRRDFSKVIGTAAIAPAGLAAAQEGGSAADWSLKANVAECCSCEIPCPCNFGRPTDLRCDGNRLIEIYEGHVGDMDLTGVRFLATFEMGKWSRLYIDDSLSAAQNEAVDAILPLAFAFFFNGAKAIERVPLTVTRTDELITITTPASSVEMKPLAGLDGGRISISGLPSNVFHDYVQYESVKHVHEGPDRQWSHSGTNGFTSRMLASS